MTRRLVASGSLVVFLFVLTAQLSGATQNGDFFNRGASLYREGRYREAIEAFEQAIKRNDHAEDAKYQIKLIRKENVERVRNKALLGVSKSSWPSKFFYTRTLDGRMTVGISRQEVFEGDSLAFRTGAPEALLQVSSLLKNNAEGNNRIELISESPLATDSFTADLLAQQQMTVFSFLSAASRQLITAE